MTDEVKEVNTLNDWLIGGGQNLPNHSASVMGRAQFIRQSRSDIPTFRDRHSAYRYAAYLLTLAETLPDEEGQEGITFSEVLDAIRGT
jgi:hypothetical protein